ncbi:Uncharacterized protein Adt_35769 [Abeliophyllum distichum]|uniref:Uncharacterized protein n=1 Tax=Abeliophyllum distichum TaxID=126358 RepID=A0ABD1QFW9_9LAMI
MSTPLQRNEQRRSVFDKLGSQGPSQRIEEWSAAQQGLILRQSKQEELERLKKCIANLQARQKGAMEEYFTSRNFPFSNDILSEPLPDKLKMTQLTGYEGKGDPISHLNKYAF